MVNVREEFRPVKGYEDRYEISDTGKIRAVYEGRGSHYKTGSLLRACIHKCGYLQIQLQKHGKYRHHYVHRLTALHFIENPNALPQVNHIDGDKKNNSIGNLEWVSASENSRHGRRLGLVPDTRLAVMQKDLNGQFIDLHTSTAAAAENTGISRTAIINCCKQRRKTAGNYIWEYV